MLIRIKNRVIGYKNIYLLKIYKKLIKKLLSV